MIALTIVIKRPDLQSLIEAENLLQEIFGNSSLMALYREVVR